MPFYVSNQIKGIEMMESKGHVKVTQGVDHMMFLAEVLFPDQSVSFVLQEHRQALHVKMDQVAGDIQMKPEAAGQATLEAFHMRGCNDEEPPWRKEATNRFKGFSWVRQMFQRMPETDCIVLPGQSTDNLVEGCEDCLVQILACPYGRHGVQFDPIHFVAPGLEVLERQAPPATHVQNPAFRDIPRYSFSSHVTAKADDAFHGPNKLAASLTIVIVALVFCEGVSTGHGRHKDGTTRRASIKRPMAGQDGLIALSGAGARRFA
jgi:hypothetical protein